MLLINCIPCPAPVRHAVRHIHRRVFRPVGRRVHHIVHHAPRIVAYGCCAAAIGGLGGAIVAPPGGYFAPPAIVEAPPVSGYGGAAQGWPEMPAYSGMGGGISGIGSGAGIGGGGAALLPVYYGKAPVQPLGAAPSIGSTHGAPPINTTSVPEPSSVAVFLLPGLWVLVVRRRIRT